MSNETIQILKDHLPLALKQTAYMVGVAVILSVIIGGLLGLFLYLTSRSLFIKNRIVNGLAGFIINAIRSLPFLILMITLIPVAAKLTTFILGKPDPYTPTGGAIFLTIAAIPFFARIAEGAFAEVDHGVLEAAVASGAGLFLIIRKVILPESLPSLIRGIVLMIISILGFSAMVGTIGGGGIGDFAIQYGYYRYETGVLFFVIILLIIFVQVIQWIGDFLANHFTKR